MVNRVYAVWFIGVFVLIVAGSSLVSAISFSDLLDFFNFQNELVQSAQDEHHTVWLVAPEDGYYTNKGNDTLQFIYNHTGELTGIVNCTVYLDGTVVNYTANVSADVDAGVYSNTSITEMMHNWWVNCTNGTDAESSLDVGGNWSFTVDFLAPSISGLIYDSNVDVDDGSTIIRVNASDTPVGVDKVVIEENSSGAFANHTMDLESGDQYSGIYNYTLSYSSLGEVSFKIYANDTAGNLGNTSSYTIYVQNILISVNLDKSVYDPEENVTVSGKAVVLPDGGNVTDNLIYIWLDENLLGLSKIPPTNEIKLSGWKYHKLISIQNTAGDLTEYQIKIVQNFSAEYVNNKIQQYCNDIRFTYYNLTSGQETEILYWKEECNLTNSVNASFWIKVPFLENNTDTTIYMYYGNPDANSTGKMWDNIKHLNISGGVFNYNATVGINNFHSRAMQHKLGVSAGYHTCVLKPDGNVDCYGWNAHAQSNDYLGGDAIGVSAGGTHTCVLKSDGNVDCYGNNEYGQANDYVGGDAIDVSAGGHHTCVLKSDGNVDCYGNDAYGGTGMSDDYTGGDAIGVSAGGYHTCVLKSDGNVDCYGDNGYNQANDYTDGDAIGVSAGMYHTCVLRSDGNVDCYGRNSYEQANDYIDGDAIGVATGWYHTCVLKSDGNVDCYGRNNYGQASDYADGDAIGVSAGRDTNCVLKSDGNVDCYGDNSVGQANDYTGGDAKNPFRKYILPEPFIIREKEQSAISTDSNGNYNYVFQAPLEAGNHTVKVNLMDENGIYGENQTNFTQQRITIREQEAISPQTQTLHINPNQQTNISALVYKNLDNSIDSLWVNITLPDSTVKTYYMDNTTVKIETQVWHKVLNVSEEFSNLLGNYTVTFYANSTLANGSTITQEIPAPTINFYIQNISVSINLEKIIVYEDEIPLVTGTVFGKAVLQPDGTNVAGNIIHVYLNGTELLYNSSTGLINEYGDEAPTTDAYGNYSYTFKESLDIGNHIIKVNLTNPEGIYGDNETTFYQPGYPPAINIIQCENGTDWINCSEILYGSNLTAVRANCIDSNGHITNANFNLTNIPDSNTLFDAGATYNTSDLWVYDTPGIMIDDSGEFLLRVICTGNNSVAVMNYTNWTVPWGSLEPYLVTQSKNVTQDEFFTFSAGVNCTGGECGNVSALLDPLSPEDNNYFYDIMNNLANTENVGNGYCLPVYGNDYACGEDKFQAKFISAYAKSYLAAMKNDDFENASKYLDITINLAYSMDVINWPNAAVIAGTDYSMSCPFPQGITIEAYADAYLAASEGGDVENASKFLNIVNNMAHTNPESDCEPVSGVDYDCGMVSKQLAMISGYSRAYEAAIHNGDDTNASYYLSIMNNLANTIDILSYSGIDSSAEETTGDGLLQSNMIKAYADAYISANDFEDANATNYLSIMHDLAYTDPYSLCAPASGTDYSCGSSRNQGNMILAYARAYEASTIAGDSEDADFYLNIITNLANTTASDSSACKPLEGTYSCWCEGDQGMILAGYAQMQLMEGTDSGKGAVSTTLGAEPFYTIDDNPKVCLNMKPGDSCDKTWDINATGDMGTIWQFYTIFNATTYSPYIQVNQTEIVNITITTPSVITLDEPLNNSYIQNGTWINLTVTDATTSWWSNTTGTDNYTLTTPWDIDTAGWSGGLKTIDVWANDVANNIWHKVYRFTIDDMPPIIMFVDPTDTDNDFVNNRNHSYINISVSDTQTPDNLTAFLDWNNSLVGWWRFNQETGENSMFFRDWSGYGNNGTCTNCPTYTIGKFDDALAFDGIDDCIIVSDASSLDIAGEITIEAWIDGVGKTTGTIFAKAFGGTNNDWVDSIQQTSDGGYIASGSAYSFGAGHYDAFILKLNSTGGLEWSKAFGGASADRAYSIQQTADGGYIAAGSTFSFGADYEAFILKLSSTGGLEWSKAFGDIEGDYIDSIQQTADGGYIAGGFTSSFGAGYFDTFILKLSSTGGLEWSKTFGGTENERVYSIQQTSDGGYIAGGETRSFGAGHYDAFILKLNSTGGLEWSKTFGGASADRVRSIQQTADGGCIAAGDTDSFGAGGEYDAFILKLNSTGGLEWSKAFGDIRWDRAYSIQQTADGGYIVGGWTDSFGAGHFDAFILKLNSTGGLEWSKTFGGTSGDGTYSIQQTADGGYIAGGFASSFGAGSEDAFILKLDSDGNAELWSMVSSADVQVHDATPTETTPSPTETTISPTETTISPTETTLSPAEDMQYSSSSTIVSKPNSYGIYANETHATVSVNTTTASYPISSGWMHLAQTYDGSTQKFYINGNLVLGNTLSGSISTNNNSLSIGTGYNSAIDEVRIFNRVLSPEGINASYNAGLYRLYHNFTNLQDGTYDYIAYAQDLAGNVNQTEMRSLTIDTISPTQPNLISPANNTDTNDNTPDLNWTAVTEVNFNNYMIEVDDDLAFTSINYTYDTTTMIESNYSISSAWADNKWYWRVTAYDTAGNSNISGYFVYIVDATAPTITIISPANTMSLPLGTAQIWINITTDENATCRYDTSTGFDYENGTNFTNTGDLNHSFLYIGLSDGQTYNLYYKCNDSYGNINENSINHWFSVSSQAAYCGDGICSNSETCSSCPSDCGPCSPGGGGVGYPPPTAHECENNNQCSVVQICEDYECVDLECGSCEYAKNHECKKHQCCSDDECKAGDICREHKCIKQEEKKNETMNKTTDNLEEQAREAIDNARQMIIQNRIEKDTRDAEHILEDADSAYEREDYITAKEFAEQAIVLLDTAPLKKQEEPGEGLNWLLIAGIVLLLIILVAAYLKRNVIQGFMAEYRSSPDPGKIRELEEYINKVRPIVKEMKVEGMIDEKLEEKFLEIESQKDEAKKMLEENSPQTGKQIQKTVDALIELKREIEGREGNLAEGDKD